MLPNSDRVILSREQLFDLVWTKPTTAVAKDFGLSDVAISKMCKKHNIPKPPLGYWSKLRHGKKIPRPHLPKLAAETPIVISPNFAGDDQPMVEPQIAELLIQEEVADHKIIVREKLTTPHPLIRRFKDSIKDKFKDEYGRTNLYNVEVLDIRCSPQSLSRALRTMDALIRALEERGFPVNVKSGIHSYTSSRTIHTFVTVLGEQIVFRMEEPAVRSEIKVEAKYSWSKTVEYAYAPSGKLNLIIDTYSGGARPQFC